MQQPLVTVGTFAKLARTTKRTILWYEEKGVLLPTEINSKGYRYYHPQQIIDFQVILLLRKLHFSIDDIHKYLREKHSLKNVFKVKGQLLAEEVSTLEKSLTDVRTYYRNLESNGTLVSPITRGIQPFEIYSIEKIGSFNKIKEYGLELKSYFQKIPDHVTYLSLFFDTEYKPKKSRIKISVIAKPGMVLTGNGRRIVKKEEVPGFTALSHTHVGPGALLSMLWQELWRYAVTKGYQRDTTLPFVDLELYHKISLNGETDENKMEFELLLPIKKI